MKPFPLFRSSFITEAVLSFSHNSLSPQVAFPVFPLCFKTWLIFRWQWLRYWDCRLKVSSQLHIPAETDCHWYALDSNNLERLKTILDPPSADSSVNQTQSLALPFFNRPLSSCLLPQTSLRGNPFIWKWKVLHEAELVLKQRQRHFVRSWDRTTRIK